jgi:hypothetical protein
VSVPSEQGDHMETLEVDWMMVALFLVSCEERRYAERGLVTTEKK